MRIRCGQCGLDMEVPPDCEGKKLRCPGCGLAFVCQVPKAIVLDEPPPAEADEELILVEEVEQPPDPLGALKAAADGSGPAEVPAEPKASVDEALAEMHQPAPKPIVRENSRPWHVFVGGVPAVALTYQELVQRAAAGEITPKTKIRYAPEGLTIPARDISGLFAEIDAQRQQEAPKPGPARRLSRAEQDEAASLAQALAAAGAEEAAPAPPEAGDDDRSTEADALADALGELEKEKE